MANRGPGALNLQHAAGNPYRIKFHSIPVAQNNFKILYQKHNFPTRLFRINNMYNTSTFYVMSHAKNLQSFGKLKGICTGLGGAYNPGQQHLQVKALTTLQFNAQQMMDKVTEAKTVYDNVTNSRELAFKDVRAMGSRICFLLRACGAHPLTLADAYASNRRLHGWKRYAAPIAHPTTGEPAEALPHRKGAGNDYASIAYHFAQLVETAIAEPRYVINEPALNKEGLERKVAEIHQMNEVVMQATLKLNHLKKQRHAIFYVGANSLVETARAVRNYVRGAFGFKSNPHLDMSKVSLTKPTT